jgi:hypothetical protein
MFMIIGIGIFTFISSPIAQIPTISIREIQDVPFGHDISIYNGQMVNTGGIVTVGTGVFSINAGVSFFLEESCRGSFSGIVAYCPQTQGFPLLMPGDSVILTALVSDNGMTALNVLPGSITVVRNYQQLMAEKGYASVLDSAYDNDVAAEIYEGVFKSLEWVTVDSVIPYANSSKWLCHDQTGSFIVRECSDSISFLPQVGTIFPNLQGVVYQTERSYELRPRFIRDLILETGGLRISDVTINPGRPSSDGNIIIAARINCRDNINSAQVIWWNRNGHFTGEMDCYNNIYSYVIEAQFPETQIGFYIRAATVSGDTANSPDDAPINCYSFNVQSDQFCQYLPGDVNDDGQVDGLDLKLLVECIKLTNMPPPQRCFNGALPRDHSLYVAADANGDCRIGTGDITRLCRHLMGRVSIGYCRLFPPTLKTPY